MRKILLAALSGFLLHGNYSQAQEYSYNVKFTVSKKNFVDSIPIEFHNGRIILKAYSGDREYRFLLDTGSSQGVIYENSMFNYVRKRGTITSHDANGTSHKIMTVEYPRFRIGSLVIEGYCGSLLPRQSNSDSHDAIIGFDIINKGPDTAVLRINQHFIHCGNKKSCGTGRKVPHIRIHIDSCQTS